VVCTLHSPLSIGVMKEELRILSGAHPMSPQGFARLRDLCRIACDSHDYREGIEAFKEHRKRDFHGD
jgi:methylmalonyl-CoA decarboxylase